MIENAKIKLYLVLWLVSYKKLPEFMAFVGVFTLLQLQLFNLTTKFEKLFIQVN